MFANAFEGVNSSNIEAAIEGLITALNDRNSDNEIINNLNDNGKYFTASMRPPIFAMRNLIVKKNKIAIKINKYRTIPSLITTYKTTYNSAKNAYKRWQRELNKDDDSEADYYERVYLNYKSRCDQLETRIKSIVGDY